MREWHTKILPRNDKLIEEFKRVPRTEFWFNCRGDCLIYENNILKGIERKNGNYIDLSNINKL
jgi:hypothetical protein